MDDQHMESGNHKIEAYFLGGLAFIVFGVVLFAALNTKFGNSANAGNRPVITQTHSTKSGGYVQTAINNGQNADLICSCYNDGYELAGRNKDVQSTAYRTGFTQCRSLASVEGGNAWTAGWEARLSGRAFEASCKAYKRRG